MEPVRVLHIEITNQIGGIERFLYSLYQSINHKLVQFDFITTTKEPAFAENLKGMGARIFTVTSYTQNPFQYYSDLKRIMQQENYEIVHIHKNSVANILPMIIGDRLKIKTLIVHSHNTASTRGFFFDLLHYINRNKLAHRATTLLACSEQAAVWLYGNTIVKSKKATIIHNGIDAEQFRFNETIRQSYRDHLNINGKFVVGHIGRFTNQKNHDFLLDIFKEVYSRNPQAVLLLIGSGELKQAVQDKVNRLGLNDAVRLLGVRHDVSQLMQMMDVFLFPSRYEGLGIVLIEAQAAGLKCVASDTIPSEAKITDHLKLINLNEPKEAWADEILKYRNGYTREDTYGQIVSAGYDCKDTARRLQELYLERTGRL